jgi:pimeloyl-ACP methyl ester carboxylesterase
MIFKRLASSLTVLGLGLTAATAWRLQQREAAALAHYPPTGQFVSVDGQRIHMQIMGSGPDLVLIHGASGNLRDFTMGFAQNLANRYRVIAVDRPGLGYSDPMPGDDPSVAGQARVLRDAVAQIGATHPIVLGQSYGGTVALAWALQDPPAALVLVSAPSLPWPGKLDWWYQATSSSLGHVTLVPLAAAFVPESYIRRAILDVFAPESPPPGYLEHFGVDLTLRRGPLGANVTQVNSLRPQVVEMQSEYPKLTLPVELVHGDADTIVPLSIHSEPLSHILPNAHLTVIPGAGHMPHHTHQQLVFDAIDRAAARAQLR